MTTSPPCRISAARVFTLRLATLVNWSTSPACNHGAPQHPASLSRHSMPLRSYTPTRSLPIEVAWYSTKHVGKTTTEYRRAAATGVARRLNHVEKRCLAYGGSTRTADTPVNDATALRTSEPSRAPITVFVIEAVADPSLPTRSVW